MAFLFTKDKKQCFSCWEVQGGGSCAREEERASGRWSGEQFVGGPLRSSLALYPAVICCDLTRGSSKEPRVKDENIGFMLVYEMASLFIFYITRFLK